MRFKGASLESKPPSVGAFRHWRHSAKRHTRALAGLHRSPLFWLAPAGFRRFICPPRDLSLSASWRWRGAVSFLCQSQSSRPTPERGVCVSRGGGTFHTGEGFASGSRPSTLAPGRHRGRRYKKASWGGAPAGRRSSTVRSLHPSPVGGAQASSKAPSIFQTEKLSKPMVTFPPPQAVVPAISPTFPSGKVSSA